MNTILTDIVRRTRQHHAIEHATIHVLTERFPRQPFSGLSDPLGFILYGDFDEALGEENVRRAVGEALLRLQAGESNLAVHPNCGTNLAVTGLLVTLIALQVNRGKRNVLEKFTTTLLLVLPTLILARPLGMYLQTYTTLADTSDRWVAQIHPVAIGDVRVYR